MFKMSKNWSKAGDCFHESAVLHDKGGSRHDAGSSFVDASNCYKKVNEEYIISLSPMSSVLNCQVFT